jgi:protein-disulfide isomerase
MFPDRPVKSKSLRMNIKSVLKRLAIAAWSYSAFATQFPTEAAPGKTAGPVVQETRQVAESFNLAAAFASSKGPGDAPVTVIEFSDFECPFCGRVVPAVQELLRANPQKIRFIFKHNPLAFHTHSILAHEAAMAAGAQGKFWEMHDLLFANQGRLTEDDLLRYAKQLNLNIDSFQKALDSHLYRAMVDENLEEAKGLGVTGTPTFFINGNRIVGAQSLQALQVAVDQALGLPSNPVAAGVAQPAGNGTGAPLPDHIEKVEIGGSPIRGPSDGRITIVEFSDFQCPFCAKALPTLQELERQYPKGVRWVFKNFPLEFHPDSLLAHKAALAAGEQGHFWEMHDLIFANQGAIKRDDLIQKASQLGLDVKRFVADMDSNRFQTALDADKAEAARLGVTGTPTFFINGKRMIGAGPLAEYQKLVESELGAGGNKKTVANAAIQEPAAPPKKVAADRPSPRTALNPKAPSKGPETAPVTITWYSDLESPLSLQANQIVRQLLDIYPAKIRVVFKNLPMEFHSHAFLAHQAALAAGAQGKFWEMHDLILANQKALTRDDLLGYAKRLGLDREKFISGLDAHVFQANLDNDLSEAKEQGVFGAPAFFVNGKRLDGVQPLATFKDVIQTELNLAQPQVQASK